MLQIAHLSCLVSPPVDRSAALRQAAHLASTAAATEEGGAILHVVALHPVEEASFAETVRDRLSSVDAEVSLTTHVLSVPDEPDAVRRALQDVMDEIGDGLLVLDSPTDCAPVPALADDWMQVLMDGVQGPIFVVDEATFPEDIENILVPTDLSDESIHTLKHATELADGYDASVVLRHVVETSPYVALTPTDRLSMGRMTLTEHRVRRVLQQFLDKECPPGVAVQMQIVFGDLTERIVHFVREKSVDVMVLGTDDPSKSPPGSLVERLLRRVKCSTLLVRAGDGSLLPGRSREEFDSESSSQEEGH